MKTAYALFLLLDLINNFFFCNQLRSVDDDKLSHKQSEYK